MFVLGKFRAPSARKMVSGIRRNFPFLLHPETGRRPETDAGASCIGDLREEFSFVSRQPGTRLTVTITWCTHEGNDPIGNPSAFVACYATSSRHLSAPINPPCSYAAIIIASRYRYSRFIPSIAAEFITEGPHLPSPYEPPVFGLLCAREIFAFETISLLPFTINTAALGKHLRNGWWLIYYLEDSVTAAWHHVIILIQ